MTLRAIATCLAAAAVTGLILPAMPAMGTAAGTASVTASVPTSAAAPATFTVAWRDKPPYHFLDQGQPKGFLLERTRLVFATAGIPTRFVNEPQKRIWAKFTHGASNYCSISWYRLPEREAVAQYSAPIHIDPPHILLVSANAVARVQAHATLSSLLTDSTLTLGAVDGVSYGPELDALIKSSKNKVMMHTVDTTSMMRMLSVGRASFMFVDREDWEYFRAHEGITRTLVQHDFADMPAGLKRHIVCSRDVPQATIDKLNQAIAATGGPSNGARNQDTPKKARLRP